MAKPRVSIIVALDEESGIGKSNGLLWHIPEDLKRFKELTMSHPIVMGRKTHESIGRALPGRTNIVITRQEGYRAEGCKVHHLLEDALAAATSEDDEEVFVIGGAQIYEQALSLADRLYLTRVKGTYEADTFFPAYEGFTEREVGEEKQLDGYTYHYAILDRTD